MAVSLTTTINLLFGSTVIVPETGVIMNNEMDGMSVPLIPPLVLTVDADFSISGSNNSFGYRPSPANFIRPGKRPLSSITPTIVTRPDGSVHLVVGAAGGSRIITATIQDIINVIDEGMSAAEALAQPRLHDQLIPDEVTFEYAYDNTTVAFMDKLGHNVTWVAPGDSAAQAVRVLRDGSFEAVGEPRQANSGGVVV
jgi:gamma-glutamyltranspeptidase/glutathione hydrolase